MVSDKNRVLNILGIGAIVAGGAWLLFQKPALTNETLSDTGRAFASTITSPSITSLSQLESVLAGMGSALAQGFLTKAEYRFLLALWNKRAAQF